MRFDVAGKLERRSPNVSPFMTIETIESSLVRWKIKTYFCRYIDLILYI